MKSDRINPMTNRQRRILLALKMKPWPWMTIQQATGMINAALCDRGLGGRTRGARFRPLAQMTEDAMNLGPGLLCPRCKEFTPRGKIEWEQTHPGVFEHGQAMTPPDNKPRCSCGRLCSEDDLID